MPVYKKNGFPMNIIYALPRSSLTFDYNYINEDFAIVTSQIFFRSFYNFCFPNKIKFRKR